MLSNTSPIRPNSREDSGRTDRTKPQGSPRNDDFRKSMRDRGSSKEEHVSTVEDREESPSVFDLSKKNKSKPKSSSTSQSKKESSSDFASNRPVTSKPERDESQDHASNEEATTEYFQSAADDLFAAVDDSQLTFMDESFQEPEIEIPQPKMPEDLNKLPDQSLTKDALRQQAAALQSQKTKGLDKTSSFETGNASQSSKKQKTSKREESRNEGANEVKGDASAAVNASIQSVGFRTDKAQEGQESSRSATIKEIVTQIVDRIQIMRKDNETHTTITLRHPPLLEGATITLTTTDHAKREFNIAFANLSPDAKLLLDRKFKEDSLTETLERKGIIVHMLTTSTQENPLNIEASGQSFRDRQEQQQQQQQQQQRQQRFQEPEEEETP